jgi:hypothetical protein
MNVASHNIGFGLPKVPKFIRNTGRAIGKNLAKGAKLPLKVVKGLVLLPITVVLKTLQAGARVIIMHYYNGGLKRIAERRARFLAFKIRRSKIPTLNEINQGKMWALKFLQANGVLNKMLALVGGKVKKMAADPNVAAHITNQVAKSDPLVRAAAISQIRSYRLRGGKLKPSGVGFAGIDDAVIAGAVVSVCVAIIKAVVERAAKQGAPANPEGSSPEPAFKSQESAPVEYYPPQEQYQEEYSEPEPSVEGSYWYA